MTADTILKTIADNTSQGASALAQLGLQALEEAAKTLPPDAKLAEKAIRGVAKRLDEVRPSMGAIGVLAAMAVARAAGLVAQGTGWSEAVLLAVRQEREILSVADQTIARFALGEIGTGGRLVTCSWSMTALTVLATLKPETVRLGEGDRMGDGLRAAQWLARRGIAVEVVPDNGLAHVVDGARAVVVGADEILSDGSVLNRCGTFALALSAGYHGVPFYAVCHRMKLAGKRTAHIEMLEGAFADLPVGVTARAPMFDLTPPGLIHRVITESGSLTTEQVVEICDNIRRMKEQETVQHS